MAIKFYAAGFCGLLWDAAMNSIDWVLGLLLWSKGRQDDVLQLG